MAEAVVAMEEAVVEGAVAGVVADNVYRPARLTVQWHITDRCNLRCQHCYQTGYTDKGLDFTTLKFIASEVFALHSHWAQSGVQVPLQFTITGGEPCTYPDFKVLLHHLSAHASKPSLAILSNGHLIDAKLAQTFAQLNVSFVQLSVEGTPDTHDTIRGKNNFKDVIRASQILTDAGIRVIWSFTAHHNNFREFTEVAKRAQQFKINRIWSDRMIPTCHTDNSTLALNAEETSEYLQLMYTAKCHALKQRPHKTEVALFRALQFQAGGDQPYRCTAGNELITIMPDGNLYPCRRLPISVGNLRQTPLIQLYNAALMQQLRSFTYTQSCAPCVYKTSCKGGLRCMAYAVNGDLFSQDPGCQALMP